MTVSWEFDLRKRLDAFARRQTIPNGLPISIKIRVSSGCFHREHSPKAYALIDAHLNSNKLDSMASFEEHESGPEVLVYLAYPAAIISLASSVINLVIAIIKSRSQGIQKGDGPSDALELIVRTFGTKGDFREECILHTHSSDLPDERMIEHAFNHAINRMLIDPNNVAGERRITSKTTTLTRSKGRSRTKGKRNK